MSFYTSVKSMIDKYGSKIEIMTNDKTVRSKAFIQPLRYKSTSLKDREIAFGGFTDGRYYLYIGHASHEFSRKDNAIITCNGKKYVVHTSEAYELSNKKLYVWAVLTPYKEQRRDDYETDTEQY